MNNNCLNVFIFFSKNEKYNNTVHPHFDINHRSSDHRSMENTKHNNTTVRQYQVVLQLVPKHSINGGLKIK